MDQEQYKQLKNQGVSDDQIMKFGGVSQDDIKSFNQQPSRAWYQEILPTAGGVLGGIGGAALGGLAGIETGPGAVATGYAGGVAGSAAGGALGEAAEQGLEKMFGQRKEFSGGDIARTAGQMGVMEAVGGPIFSAAGKLISKGGEALAEAVIPKSVREAGMEQAYKAAKPATERAIEGIKGLGQTIKQGITGVKEEVPKVIGKIEEPINAAKTAFEQGIMGTESMIGVQAKRTTSKLWDNTISPALKSADEAGNKINLNSFFDDAEKSIIENNPEKTRQNSLLNALNSIREDYAGMKDVTLSELQKLKEGWAKFVPEKAYKGQPIAGSLGEVRNFLAGNARNTIYNSLGQDVKEAYIHYGNLQGLMELGKKAMTGSGLKGGAGTFLSTLKDTLLVPIGTIGGKSIYRIGQGIELMGRPGARVLRDLIPAKSGLKEDITGQSMTSDNQ